MAKHSTGLKIPPPVFYITALLSGLSLQHYFPAPFSSDSLLSAQYRWGLAAVFLLPALIIITLVMSRYKNLNTPFDVRQNARALVITGPNRFSRNPGYLALTLFYLGLGVLLDNMWVFALLVPVLLLVDLWVIRREERNLEAQFGREYRLYKSGVRRWF